MIEREQITGLVLAGGRGQRMGGVDKGLQPYRGQPLTLQVLRRLSPQVGRVMISANRNLPQYQTMGVPVWPDAEADFAGPLAGFLSGLRHCETAYLVTVPCDSPRLPTDLVLRLAEALSRQQADIAMAATPHENSIRLQPAFCLIKRDLTESLFRFMQSGQRKVEAWTAQHRRAEAVFNDEQAFFNANTPEELEQLQRSTAFLDGEFQAPS
jgi:molybdenum cofactor guanylyltransferase